MWSKKFVVFVLPEETYASQVQSRWLNRPWTPAMIWNTLFVLVVVTASPPKSITRYSVHGFRPSLTVVAGLSREASNVARAAGIGRPSIGTGADQTVMAGG